MKKKEILRLKQLLGRVPFSRATIDRLERAGKFPRRHHLGRIVFWVEDEVDSYLANLATREKSNAGRAADGERVGR